MFFAHRHALIFSLLWSAFYIAHNAHTVWESAIADTYVFRFKALHQVLAHPLFHMSLDLFQRLI